MGERGAVLIEALIVTLTAAVVGMVALQAIAVLPERAAAWEEAAAVRQRVRVVEARLARIASRAARIELEVDGESVAIPSLWPRRLGLFRAGGETDVSSSAVTFLSRTDAHRTLMLASALSGGGDALVYALPGCGADAACGVRAGDFVLIAAADGACGLFRVTSIGSRWNLLPLMPPGAPAFPAGSVIVPIVIDVIDFAADEGAIRRYDGYRSDSVMADGVRDAAFAYRGDGAVALGDGPFVGTGPLAYDIDQLRLDGIGTRIFFAAPAPANALEMAFEWRLRPWP